MSNPNGTGEAIVRMDGVMAKINTGYAAPCGHEGTVVALTKGGAGRAEGFKCLACGQTFVEDPNEEATKEYGEAVDRLNKEVCALLEQAERSVDCIAGKPTNSEQGDIPGGSTPSLYALPRYAVELQDLIEHRGMNFAVGNIFKACYRLGMKRNVDAAYDLRKILFFAERELRRIENLSE